MEDRFVTEAMLGKLAKWLRIMGYDVLYQRLYQKEELVRLVASGRKVLSRRIETQTRYPGVILIHADHVGDQLKELKDKDILRPDPSRFFARCLLCNTLLKPADPEAAKSSLPDHVLQENLSGIRSCPECGRFFWPGTHREKMLRQLASWGLLGGH
jgi:hypothetical protein